MVGLGLIAGNDAAGDVVPPVGEPAWVAPSIAALPDPARPARSGAHRRHRPTTPPAGIVPTLQWTPRRTTLFLARVVVVVGTATVLGMLLAIACGAAAFSMASDILVLPLDEGLDVVGTVGIVFAAGRGAGRGARASCSAAPPARSISVFLLVLLLPLVLPQFPYEWMLDLASALPGTGAMFLLTGESIGEDMTRASAIVTMVAWAVGALALGWLRLVRDDANR